MAPGRRPPAHQARQVDGFATDDSLPLLMRDVEHVVDQAHHAADLAPVARHHLVQLSGSKAARLPRSRLTVRICVSRNRVFNGVRRAPPWT
jgi:hypothetical protein